MFDSSDSNVFIRVDIAGWPKASYLSNPSGERWEGGRFQEAAKERPHWIYQVLPHDAELHGGDRKFCHRIGIMWCWLMDTAARTLHVLKHDGDSYKVECTTSIEGRARLPPFIHVELDLAALLPSRAQSSSSRR
jgi:hypothetical protein